MERSVGGLAWNLRTDERQLEQQTLQKRYQKQTKYQPTRQTVLIHAVTNKE